MALESTAINDLIAGLQRRPLERRDSDNWLFGEAEPERDDATEIDSSREDKATSPFQRDTPSIVPLQGNARVVPLPGPFVREPAAAIELRRSSSPTYPINRSSSPTTHVRARNWGTIAKVAALPIGLSCIVIVLLGVYFAKSSTKKKPASVTVTAKVEAVEVPPAPPAQPAAAPAVASPAPTTIPPPIVTPIEEPKAAAATPTAAPAPEAPKAEAPKPEAPGAAPKSEPAPAAAPAAAAEVANVEPGSPASRFLGPAAEPTVPTIAAKKPTAAPAPTVVPDLPPPPANAQLGVEIQAKPVVKPKPVKKTVAQVRAEKRAAKRAAKGTAQAKARSKKRVAAAEEADEDEEADKPADKAANGKGVLAISSTPAMEVWVDGRNSRAETPVRIILLSGKHKVTLFDKAIGKARSFDIEIKPDQVTKVSKSF